VNALTGGIIAIVPVEGKEFHMQYTSVKKVLLTLVLTSALPVAACGKDDTPTSPTQPGPPVTTTPPPAPQPTPPPTPEPQPPADDRPTVTLTGTVVNLDRSGAGDLDISFRIDDFTIVRASNGTPVISGAQTFNTDAVRNGQGVSVEGKRTNGFLDATKITIVSQAP
jgi:hypothetical protein